MKWLSGNNGTMKSHKEYGISDYYNNMNCTWTIAGHEDKVIYLKFVSFDVEPGSDPSKDGARESKDCDRDSLTIYDGTGSNRSEAKVVCGSKLPVGMYTVGPNTSLIFTTNNAVTKKGFLLMFSVVDKPGKRICCQSDMDVSPRVCKGLYLCVGSVG